MKSEKATPSVYRDVFLSLFTFHLPLTTFHFQILKNGRSAFQIPSGIIIRIIKMAATNQKKAVRNLPASLICFLARILPTQFQVVGESIRTRQCPGALAAADTSPTAGYTQCVGRAVEVIVTLIGQTDRQRAERRGF